MQTDIGKPKSALLTELQIIATKAREFIRAQPEAAAAIALAAGVVLGAVTSRLGDRGCWR